MLWKGLAGKKYLNSGKHNESVLEATLYGEFL